MLRFRVAVLMFFAASLRADYVVLRQEAGALPQPLALADLDRAQQQELYRILTLYQWPTASAAYDFGLISPAEGKKLFTPDVPRAEEEFIREKVHTSPLLGPAFDVVFIPKAIYELFALYYILKHLPERDFARRVARYFALQQARAARGLLSKKQMQERFFYDGDVGRIDQVPAALFQRDWLLLNEALGGLIMRFCRKLRRPYGVASVEESLVARRIPFTKKILRKLEWQAAALASSEAFNLLLAKVSLGGELASLHADFKRFHLVLERFSTIRRQTSGTFSLAPGGVLARMIELECRLHEQNRAYLLRATSGAITPGVECKSLDSLWRRGIEEATVPVVVCDPVAEDDEGEAREQVEKRFYVGQSLSFGNSLFAGTLFDRTASVFWFLEGSHSEGGYNAKPEWCYALLINKLSYLKDACYGLFSIPPIPTFSALFGMGELFHPRTYTVIWDKEESLTKRGVLARIGGFAGFDGTFFADMLLTNKDLQLFFARNGSASEVYAQAMRFQQYLAGHAYFIRATEAQAEQLKAAAVQEAKRLKDKISERTK